MLVQWCLFLVFQFLLVNSHKNNVCRNFKDYASISDNKNCWFNPDFYSSPPLIAKRYGYPLEKYAVTTEDGYILTLFRIPHNNTDPNAIRQPVLIQHGIAARGIFWMLQGQKSLAFLLANNGYDVWLSTARGAEFSTQHKNLTIEDPLYWNFGFHEMAIYDLPAIFEVISNTTRQKGNIIYIGHSMGTTMSYVYSAEKRDHAAAHLKALISLSPVAFMKNVKGLYRQLVPLVDDAAIILSMLGIHSIGDHIPGVRKIITSLCGSYPTINYCQLLLASASGIVSDQVRPDIIPLMANYIASGTSIKTLKHFSQLILSGGKFQKYDYGLGNIEMYKTITPPPYDVTTIPVPVYLFIGQEDFLAPDADVNILYKKLNSPQSSTNATRYYFNFAHNDFFMGRHLKNFYKVLLDVMKNKIDSKKVELRNTVKGKFTFLPPPDDSEDEFLQDNSRRSTPVFEETKRIDLDV